LELFPSIIPRTSFEIDIFFLLIYSTSIIKFKMNITFCSLDLWVGNNSPFIVIDHQSICNFDEAEEIQTLANLADSILDVEDIRSIPISDTVNIAMVACRDDQILILHGHVDDSLFEIEF
jgi:hypothetical protein